MMVKIDGVTAEDVQGMAQKYPQKEGRFVVLIGNIIVSKHKRIFKFFGTKS